MDQRKQQRFRLMMAVRVHLNGAVHHWVTRDVGIHGLFVRADQPPAPRQFLRMEVDVPGRPEPLQMHAVVADVEVGGFGATFYGLSRTQTAEWTQLVHSVRLELRDDQLAHLA